MGTRVPSHQLRNGLYVSGRPDHHHPTIGSPDNVTGADANHSGDHPPPVLTRSCRTSGSDPTPNHSGSGRVIALQPTGLITSGSLGMSGESGSGQMGPETSSGKTVYGPSVTTLGYDDLRLGFRVSRKLMWVLLVMAVMGLVVGAVLTVVVKKVVVVVVAAAVLVPVIVVILWNCVFKKRGLLGYLRKYPDDELRGAVDGQFVKITGIVTCGSIPLESSFQKVERCVYVSTELFEHKRGRGKSPVANHCCFSWGCSNSEKYVADFYISDMRSGLRALVKAGYGAKVAPFVKEATVVDITKEKRELSPRFLEWLADRSLSSDDRLMRLKEGYIKEGSTVSVMGVVRRHDNLLMIVPPGEPMSTGCRWSCGLLPTYVEGLVLTCDESQNADASLPV
ncbi:putative uncharacterized membrane protein [Helianthus annuus]|uniref:Uncharacterized membrane protein n=1 Tax=Helianthus annuus TaxID=4232 RepID=A0A251RZV1_HELAN|nr:uncharacterized membrane protein At1g16860 [Helianthus annuus]KAF5760530.1 putative uncharacterized membrane protein [Helianthus annuus]KAJ0438547.1 putative uncharacterized membrane protein [Helianthus annuus]KAJ0641314.1 putative uncharacterized membrane protein [Helianthus annuus]KAJ0645218.1 putative uncharacterized membrane protein [Helianthus annuus]KAJ0821693.1 putative uncharacterized membrane protein [Helianthus annuus]